MSAKNIDKRGRHRNVTIAFRVSPEENKQINDYVSVTGLTKQEYLTKNMLHHTIEIRATPKVYKALKEILNQIYSELKRIENSSSFDEEYLEFMKYIFEIMKGLN